jgi:hypothetical protein
MPAVARLGLGARTRQFGRQPPVMFHSFSPTCVILLASSRSCSHALLLMPTPFLLAAAPCLVCVVSTAEEVAAGAPLVRCWVHAAVPADSTAHWVAKRTGWKPDPALLLD